MKLLIINTSERTGGAAVAANRLMNALDKNGIEVSMLVRDRQTTDLRVLSVNNTPWKKRFNLFRFVWERLIIFACNLFNRKNLFQVSIANTGIDLSKHPAVQQADVIHLHWINQGLLSLSGLQKLIQTGKPIVWTLHDLWPATAICHYPGNCTRYTTQCRACPLLNSNRCYDLAKAVFQEKQQLAWRKISFVGCSQWIVNEARKGTWMQHADFTSIPNAIDTTLFKPIPQQEARKALRLPTGKQLLLFAAAKLSDYRKGAIYLVQACKQLANIYGSRLEIVLMGNCSDELINQIPFQVNSLGYLSDQSTIAMAYAAADLFVIPSLEDNLPNTIMEAMACGTPCVGFDTGGIPEMIEHEKSGYVARYQDTDDLAKGIQWVLDNPRQTQLRQACIQKVQNKYEASVVARQYIQLYQQLIQS